MKRLAITMGDPAGIGPEIIAKALASPAVRRSCVPVVIGDTRVMKEVLRLLGSPLKLKIIETPMECSSVSSGIDLIDPGTAGDFEKARPSAESGSASASYIRKAVALAMEKQMDAIVTAPVSKEALKMAGMKWPGHTEMLAEMTDTRDFTMMLVGGPLRVVLTTIHTSLRNVPLLITRETVLRTLRLARRACRMLGIEGPRIAVAGLNPHAGEAGIFGDEEINEITPAIEAARQEGIPASGPFPPDTVFHRAYRGEFDVIVCMYHDQGLIPLKMIAFETGVNVTVGLPLIRTSPDHGTAYEIAWKGIADPSSMIEAINLAARLRL